MRKGLASPGANALQAIGRRLEGGAGLTSELRLSGVGITRDRYNVRFTPDDCLDHCESGAVRIDLLSFTAIADKSVSGAPTIKSILDPALQC